jgi:class 3 adenylate cyclase/GAF domain-containing protein
MEDPQFKTMQEELRLRKMELELIQAIDKIRDEVSEPGALLVSTVDFLADWFKVDLCMLFLIDRETGVSELKAERLRGEKTSRLEQAIPADLAERVTHLDQITLWSAREVLPVEASESTLDDLHLMAVPIILGVKERLGGLLLARSGAGFTENDVYLMRSAENQIDSLLIQGYSAERMQQFAKELDTIFRIDRIRDQNLPFDQMLNAVIGELTKTVEAEMGFIMLYDLSGKELEIRASAPQNLIPMLPYYDTVSQVADKALEEGKLIMRNGLAGGVDCMMCLPLILNDRIIGVLGMANRLGRCGFTQADARFLTAIGSQIDTAIYERNEIRLLRRVLGRSVDPRVMERLLTNPDVDFMKGELLELSVLFADLRGSTHLAENTEPERLVEFIKDYFSEMTEVIFLHEGTVDKFVGDEVMVLFGAPIPQQDHALRSIQAAVAMQAAFEKVRQRWGEKGLPIPQIGIGISTGSVIAGEMGGPQRAEYTVIGRAVNLGARICASAGGGEILVSQRTYDLLKDRVEMEAVPGQQFKGIESDVTVYRLVRIK